MLACQPRTKDLVLGLATLRETGGGRALTTERSGRLGALAAEAASGRRAGGLGATSEGLEAGWGAVLESALCRSVSVCPGNGSWLDGIKTLEDNMY